MILFPAQLVDEINESRAWACVPRRGRKYSRRGGGKRKRRTHSSFCPAAARLQHGRATSLGAVALTHPRREDRPFEKVCCPVPSTYTWEQYGKLSSTRYSPGIYLQVLASQCPRRLMWGVLCRGMRSLGLPCLTRLQMIKFYKEVSFWDVTSVG